MVDVGNDVVNWNRVVVCACVDYMTNIVKLANIGRYFEIVNCIRIMYIHTLGKEHRNADALTFLLQNLAAVAVTNILKLSIIG